ncbi:MAG: rhomboid family intramembrane serine protease [Acidobacteriota bacterium]
MFLPIGDSPNPPGTPWVTYLLIGANVLVYLALLPLSTRPPDPADPAFRDYVQVIAQERHLSLPELRTLARQVSAYDLFTFEHGLKPAAPEFSDLLMSMFLHGGFLHLFGNMLFLWIYGDNVEHRLGRAGFLLAYLATGVAASGGDGLLRMGSAIPSVGASGAISGVLGFYFLWFPRNRVRVWVFLFPFIANVVELPARLVLGFFIIIENFLPLVLTAGAGGVSYGAHLGGFVAGGAAAWLLDRLSQARPERVLRPAAVAGTPPPAAGAVQRFRDALDTGGWEAAAGWYFAAPHAATRHAVSPLEKIRLGHALVTHGHPRAALAAYQRALADHPTGPGRAAAHLGAARVLMEALGNPTGAYQHLYAALEEHPSPAEAAEARELLAALAGLLGALPRNLPN